VAAYFSHCKIRNKENVFNIIIDCLV